MHNQNPGRTAFLVLFTASGFAGLIYESIWSHYLKLFLGHAAYAQTLVLVIFMGGMAAGSWWVAGRSRKLGNLLLGYAIVEALIGLLGLAFHAISRGATSWAFSSVIPHLDSVALVTTFKWTLAGLLILPQSILLGMTFPLMSGAIVRRFPERSGSTLALLYFTNCLGAAAGVLVSGFVLIGAIGLPGTVMTAGLLNLLLALVVWALSKRDGQAPAMPVAESTQAIALPSLERLILVGAFATGAAAFMYEIAWIRMLALVLGSSTHAFELMLSAFILGIALGGWWVKRRIDVEMQPLRFLGMVTLLMATVALLTLHFYNASFDWMAAIVAMFAPTEAGFVGYHLGSHAIALVLMVPTTVFCGMTLPVMTQALIRTRAGERAIGAVYAWNTVGAIVGTVLAVHLLMPLVGVKGLMIAGAMIHIALGIWYLASSRSAAALPRPALVLAGVAGLSLVAALSFAQLDPRRMTSGVFRHGVAQHSEQSQVLFFRHGKTASISLVETDGAVAIATNGKPDAQIQMQSGAASLDEITMALAAGLPLTMHPKARQIANIGIGSGLTTHVLLADPDVESVDTIEIEPLMAQAARLGFGPRVRNAFEDPRSHLHFEDAKTFFAAHRKRYDIIVSEPSNPWVSGVASLFSAEFYAQLVDYLQPDGLMVQWLQIYETDPATVTSVLRALAPHFADFQLYRTDEMNMLIVASRGGPVPPITDRALRIPALAAELSRIGIGNLRDMESRLVGTRALLLPALLLSGIPANSDYFPYVDQNAIRARVLRRDALQVLEPATDPTAMLDLLLKRPAPTGVAADSRSRSAAALSAAVLGNDVAQLQPEAAREVVMLGATPQSCVQSGTRRAWLDTTYRIAVTTTPALGGEELGALWGNLLARPCAQALQPDERQWVDFLRQVALRDGGEVYRLGRQLLEGSYVFGTRGEVGYAAQATVSAAIAAGQAEAARGLMARFRGEMLARGTTAWTVQMLDGLIAALPAAHAP